MVAGSLAIDLIARKYAFSSQRSYSFTEGETRFTEDLFASLALEIQVNIREDIGQTVIIAPSTLTRDLKNYFTHKLDEIGIINIHFIRIETAYVIGALEYARVMVNDDQNIAIFYRNENRFIGDQWKKNGSVISFEKRICYSSNETGLQIALNQAPNHILVSSEIQNARKCLPNIRFQVFQENSTFLIDAALIYARIIFGDKTLKPFYAQDIGDIQIAPPRTGASKQTSSGTIKRSPDIVIGISIGSDTYSVAKYEKGKAEIIKNPNNEETTKCIVAAKDGQLFVGGNQTDAVLLEHCIDLLGAMSIKTKEPFTKLNLSINDDAPYTKVCYNANGRVINAERVAAEILRSIKAMISNIQADIVFALSPEIKNNPEKWNVFLRLAKEAGLEHSKIVDNSLALCLGGSQGHEKKDNGTFIGINVSDKKVDAILFQFVGNKIDSFKEASRTLPPHNPNNNEFVAELREHLLVIAKTAFDVLKSLNIERTDVSTVLLNYTGKFRETTKEFLQRMFMDKQIIELQNSRSLTALGAAIYGAI